MLALAVRGENAILGIRTMMGATNPADSAPGTIRGDFATAPLGEHRPRLRLEDECQERALALLPGRPDLSRAPGMHPGTSSSCHGRRQAQPRGLDEGERRIHRREGKRELGGGRRSPGASSACPKTSLGTLGDVAGLDVVELGCGTAYVSAWLARRGARPVGVDVTPAQLATARRCQDEFGIEFPLVEASAEDVPLPSESFDLAVSEYGASIWCDPHLWIPEAHRLLRPGGRLWFLRNSTLVDPLRAATTGSRPKSCRGRNAGLGRLEWPGEIGVEWQLPHGELFRLLRRTGFDVVDLVELYPPDDAVDHVLLHTSRSSGHGVAERGDLGRREGAVSDLLVLASSSPQRRAILEQLRIPFDAVTPDYVEHDPPNADPVALVRAHAEGKARSVHRDGAVTLGVDTTVHLDGRVFGKPAGREGCRSSMSARSTGAPTPSSPGSACSVPALPRPATASPKSPSAASPIGTSPPISAPGSGRVAQGRMRSRASAGA